MAGSPDERSLIARARAGEEDAFRLLLREHQSAVFGLAYRILRNREDAEDAAQEVFVKVHGALSRYDPQYALRSWILRITHNHCIDQIRRRRPFTISIHDPIAHDEGEFEWEIPDPGAVDPLDAVSAGETKEMIEAAIGKLAPALRTAITLRHVEGLRYDEIAAILGLPLGTVKVRIFRARQVLAKVLSRHLGEDRG